MFRPTVLYLVLDTITKLLCSTKVPLLLIPEETSIHKTLYKDSLGLEDTLANCLQPHSSFCNEAKMRFKEKLLHCGISTDCIVLVGLRSTVQHSQEVCIVHSATRNQC